MKVADYVGLTSVRVAAFDWSASKLGSLLMQDRIFAAARELNYLPIVRARTRGRSRLAGNSTDDDAGKATGALMFVGTENFLRGIDAIQKAGMRVPGDCSSVGRDVVRGLEPSSAA